MKKIKLLLAAMAAMFTMGAQAQTWTGSDPAEGTFFLYNVGAGKFINVGDKSTGWGTNAYLTADYGLDFIFEANGEAFNLNSQVSNGGSSFYLATGMWCDGGATPWTFTKVDRDDINAYTISNNGKYIIANEAGNDVEYNDLSSTERDQWQIIGSSDILANLQANTASGVRRTVATFFISDPDFGRNDLRMSPDKKVWAYTFEGGNKTIPGRDLGLGGTGNEQNYGCEFWNNTFDIHQELTNLPTGIYGFEIYGLATNGTTYIYATTTDGTTEKLFKNTNSNGKNFQGVLNDIDNFGGNTTGLFQVKDGNLTIGVKREENSNEDWTVIDQARLYYYGDYTFADAYGVDLKAYVAEAEALKVAETSIFDTSDLEEAIADAKEVLAHSVLEQDFVDATAAISQAIDTYNTNNNALIAARAAYKKAVADAAALEYKIPSKAYTTLSNAVTENTISNVENATADDLNTAADNINTAITTANALVSAYSLAADAYAIYNQTDYTDAQGAKANLKAILDGFDDLEDAEAITAAVEAAELPAAIKSFITTVKLNEGAYFDVTNFYVVNPTVSKNTDGWTAEGTPNTSYSWAVCNYGECEFYQQNFKFYQTLTLTPGTWEFGVTGFHRAGNHNTHFYAGEDKILIPGVGSDVVNTMAAAKTYFDGGNGKVALKFLIETAGDVEIGIDNQDTQTDKWTIFRNFTLKFYGAPDYSIYDQQWADALTAANEAKAAEANANVNGTELTALNAAIADAPDGSNKANYIEKIQALQDATAAFTAAAASYDKYVAYRAETVAAFGEALAATVDAPTTAAEAIEGVHNLNIAQYNKVAEDYTYSLNGLIGDFGSWTGTAAYGADRTPSSPNYLSNEHWSGQTHAYYEQCKEGWGNAGGWTIKYEKTCTLPKGDYVIKVAARTAGAGVTSLVRCSATDVTITLPAESASARGIKLNGEAGWDGENSEYARNGEGFGWQWRFLPFTLTADGEVTMTFEAEASTQYQWMSIADGELLSKNDVAVAVTYDEAENNSIKDVLVANVTITRKIVEGYNTVVLPFTLTANQVAEAFGDGSEVYTFSENSDDPDQATINFKKGDGSITANVPVLVKATTESDEQEFKGVQIVAADVATVEGTNFDFVGVYAPEVIEDGDFFLNDAKIYKSTGISEINAFRAYFDNKTDAQEVKLFIDGIAARISDINAAAENGAIFNLAGQRVSKAQKGIFIQNGKKVILK